MIKATYHDNDNNNNNNHHQPPSPSIAIHVDGSWQ
jgi:hypothetical protein